jgi:hypothetical protein
MDRSTESITDHETKCLRPEAVGGDRRVTVLYYRGPFRVYYNRKEEWPRVISIDNGSHAWEINCKSVDIAGVHLHSAVKQEANYPEPAMVLEGVGAIYCSGDGSVVIRAAE